MAKMEKMIMLGTGSPIKPPAVTGVESPIALYFYTENVDEFYIHAVAAGLSWLVFLIMNTGLEII